jgi:predicted glycoside hydrolase/deacetylase ChbG (UPF0249 family)
VASEPVSDDRVPARLVVVNADDYGLHTAVNEGILRGHRDGIVTSTSVSPCGAAYDEGAQALRRVPTLDVGVHLTLVDERPLCPPEVIPTLIEAGGLMRSSYAAFAKDWFTGRIRRVDVRRELEAQILRAMADGFRLSHLDSHQHVHCLPGLWDLTMDLARQHAVPFVRVPAFDHVWTGVRGPVVPMLRVGVNVLGSVRRSRGIQGVRTADCVKGFAFSGHVSKGRLLGMLTSAVRGVTEIGVHPAADDPDLARRYVHWGGYEWSAELQALTDPEIVEFCSRGGLTLTSFSALASAKS